MSSCFVKQFVRLEVLRPEPAFADSLAGKKVVAPRQFVPLIVMLS